MGQVSLDSLRELLEHGQSTSSSGFGKVEQQGWLEMLEKIEDKTNAGLRTFTQSP